MTRLCFGTFTKVLSLCKTENAYNYQIVGEMTKAVDSNCQYMHKNNRPAVTKLIKCERNLSKGNITDSGSGTIKKPGESISDVINASQRANKEEVVEKFRSNVIPLLDEDKKEQIILALLDIIEKDKVLDGDKKLNFEKYMGETKNVLLLQNEFALDEFLTGIFLYTAAGVKNTVGMQSVKLINESYINSLENTRRIKVVDGDVGKEMLSNELLDNKPADISENFSDDKIGLQKDPIDFDEEFDAKVIDLDRALRRLNEIINIKYNENIDTATNRFACILKDTVSLGKCLLNTVGELKKFINEISILVEEWSVAEENKESDINEGEKSLGEIFEDIKLAMCNYLSFRQDYLLARRFFVSQDSTPQDKMLAIFKQLVLDYGIFDFAYADPCISLTSDLVLETEFFVATIKDRISVPFAYMQKDQLFIKITKFIQTIEAYNLYLSLNMMPLNDHVMYTYAPIHHKNNIQLMAEFESKTLEFRSKLNRIFAEITNGETLFIYDIIDESGSCVPFLQYLSAVKGSYEKLRTLLYDKTPRDFYNFYVCNNLKYDGKAIKDINVKKLCKISDFIIISGIGGFGKSMMMRHLLLDAIDSYDELGLLPIFIQLKNYSVEDGDLADYLYSTVKQFDESITLEQLNETLNRGSCLVLFDGVDEIKSDMVLNLARDIETLTNRYSKSFFVFSSRPSQQLVALKKFTELELQPFSKIQALKMIENFDFSREDQKVKERFYEQLKNELWESHREFAENPLLLTIMIMTFEEYAEVPSKIHKFYEMAFETLIKKHDDTKLLDRELKSKMSKDTTAEYFEKICFLSYKDEKYELTESEFNNYFEYCQRLVSAKTSAKDYLYDLSYSLCLLILDGGKYRFVHRSFQEYFCAKNLKRGFEKVSTDKKESMSEGLIGFFDSHDSSRDTVLDMLYDMIPEKVEEYVIIPKLEQILGEDDVCDNNGYLNVLGRAFFTLRCWYEYHEYIEYDDESDGEIDGSYYDFAIDTNGHIESKILQFIMFDILKLNMNDSFDGTYYDNEEIMDKVPLIAMEFENIIKDETDFCKINNEPESDTKITEYYTFVEIENNRRFKSTDEYEYWIVLDNIRKNTEKHPNLMSIITSENFHLRKALLAMEEYLERLKLKQKITDEEWIDAFV